MRRGLAVMLLIGILLACPALAQNQTYPRPLLTVQSDPPNGLVFVDRTLMGNAPITLELSPGVHLVRVSLDESYFPYQETVTLQPGATLTVSAVLHRSAEGLYRDGLKAYNAGQFAVSQGLMAQSMGAPGKQVAEAPFYLGMIAEQAGRPQDAVVYFGRYAAFVDSSPSAHYHLARNRELLGMIPLAASGYKATLLRILPALNAVLQSAPPATFEEIGRLRRSSAFGDRVQLGYLLELKGDIAEARSLYRSLAESAALDGSVDLNVPQAHATPGEPPPP